MVPGMTAAETPVQLITVAAAARQLGVGKTKMYELINSGEIAVVNLPTPGGKSARRLVGERGPRPSVRVPQGEVDRFIERHYRTAPSPA